MSKSYLILPALMWAFVSVANAATCPTSFTCGFVAAQTKGLLGNSSDGEPSSIVGILRFDGSGNPTLNAVQNKNGSSLKSFTGVTGTCGAGAIAGIIRLDFSASSGPVLDMVETNSSSSTDRKFRFINEPGGTSNDTSVVVGICEQQ